jgi:hypothetical protein
MARSTITVKQIIGDARVIAGALDSTNPTDISMITKYNFVINKIYKLLNGVKFRRFMASSPMGSPSNYVQFNTADSKTYTAATKVITSNAGPPSLTNAFVGGLIAWRDHTLSKTYLSYIASVDGAGDATLGSGGAADITAGNLSYVALAPPTGVSHSIEGYRVDNVVRVHFPHSGNAPRVNEDVIESVAGNPNYDNSSAIAFTGVSGAMTIKVGAGSGTTNKGGFPVLFFEEKPMKSTAVADLVDLPTEYHAPLVEEIARLTLIEMGAKVPKAIESPLITLEAMSRTFEATQRAFAESRDK